MAVEGAHRPAWAEISTRALAGNLAATKALVAPAAVCAVVKANGYGHGALAAARALCDAGAAAVAVAIVDEGIELRNGGIRQPIILLSETPAETVADALAADLTLTVGSLDGARDVAAAATSAPRRVSVHVKVDTGMHRVGVAPEGVGDVIDVLRGAPNVLIEGLYTHLAVAESLERHDRMYSADQLTRFDNARRWVSQRGATPTVIHAANSAAAISMPRARYDLVRAGLMLYGYLPAAALAPLSPELAGALVPALSLHARVTAVHDLEAGERPSYGRRRPLAVNARVATIPFGYADGYARRLFDAGASVLIRGVRCPLAGMVTMDQLVVDCGDLPVTVGEPVVLLGAQGGEVITAEDWAAWLGTITWEVLCAIGARVPRVVVA